MSLKGFKMHNRRINFGGCNKKMMHKLENYMDQRKYRTMWTMMLNDDNELDTPKKNGNVY